MSNNEELVEVFRPPNLMITELIRLLLASRGIPCVVECDDGDRIMVAASVAEKAKRLIEKRPKEAIFE